MAARSSSASSSASARARAAAPIALAGGDGASTLLSHLAAEHSHGRGLLGFFDNAGARKSLSRVCREFRREVDGFRWQVVELRGHTAFVTDVCALADGCVVSVSCDMTLRVWNIATGACEQTLSIAAHTQMAVRMCILADGRVVTASHDETLRVYSQRANASVCSAGILKQSMTLRHSRMAVLYLRHLTISCACGMCQLGPATLCSMDIQTKCYASVNS